MQQSSKVENIRMAFHRYIEAFNKCDLSEIKRQLNRDVVVEFNGAIAAQGRDSILPSYESDFKSGKKVKVTHGPILEQKDTTIDVKVTLIATTPGEKMVQLDVIYVYDSASMTHIRHIIDNVKTVHSKAQ